MCLEMFQGSEASVHRLWGWTAVLRKVEVIYRGLLASHCLWDRNPRHGRVLFKGPITSRVGRIARPSAYLVLANPKVLSVIGKFYLSSCEVLSVFSGGSVRFFCKHAAETEMDVFTVSSASHHRYCNCFHGSEFIAELCGQWMQVSRNSDDTLPMSNLY